MANEVGVVDWWMSVKALAPNLTTGVLSPGPTESKDRSDSSDHHSSIYTTPQCVCHGMCMHTYTCTHNGWVNVILKVLS